MVSRAWHAEQGPGSPSGLSSSNIRFQQSRVSSGTTTGGVRLPYVLSRAKPESWTLNCTFEAVHHPLRKGVSKRFVGHSWTSCVDLQKARYFPVCPLQTVSEAWSTEARIFSSLSIANCFGSQTSFKSRRASGTSGLENELGREASQQPPAPSPTPAEKTSTNGIMSLWMMQNEIAEWKSRCGL